MRTIIELPADQLEALGDICRREGISRAEAIRRAVDEHIRRSRRAEPNRAFGLWRHQRVDCLEYERRLRQEWDRTSARGRRTRARR